MTAESVYLARFEISHLGIEAAIKGFGLQTDTIFLDSLQKLGYNHRAPKRTYPYPQYIAITRAILAHAMPDNSQYRRATQWGYYQYDGLGQTIVGRAAYLIFRSVSFPRALAYSVQAQNHDATFGLRRLIEVAPCHYRIVYTDDPGGHDSGLLMTCIVGAYQRMCEVLRVPSAQVSGRVTGTFSFEIDIVWNDKGQ